MATRKQNREIGNLDSYYRSGLQSTSQLDNLDIRCPLRIETRQENTDIPIPDIWTSTLSDLVILLKQSRKGNIYIKSDCYQQIIIIF